MAPKLIGSRKKNELAFRWTAPFDNGSKILNYHLEFRELPSSPVTGNQEPCGLFVEAYKGPLKQFILKKLNFSTCYGVRVAAENALGVGGFSKIAIAYTSGSVPNTPAAPQLLCRSMHSLTLEWVNDEKKSELLYELQMLDHEDRMAATHGFLTVFNGQLGKYTVEDLKRFCSYQFRVSLIF